MSLLTLVEIPSGYSRQNATAPLRRRIKTSSNQRNWYQGSVQPITTHWRKLLNSQLEMIPEWCRQQTSLSTNQRRTLLSDQSQNDGSLRVTKSETRVKAKWLKPLPVKALETEAPAFLQIWLSWWENPRYFKVVPIFLFPWLEKF